MLFINNNNGSTHLGNCIQKTFGFFPSKTWIGNRFSVNMITSDLLISRFNITLDHKPFYQSMKFRVYLAAVENLFCNTNLLVILFIRIRVVGINDNSRIFKVFLADISPREDEDPRNDSSGLPPHVYLRHRGELYEPVHYLLFLLPSFCR